MTADPPVEPAADEAADRDARDRMRKATADYQKRVAKRQVRGR
jgi:hypothetical protein